MEESFWSFLPQWGKVVLIAYFHPKMKMGPRAGGNWLNLKKRDNY